MKKQFNILIVLFLLNTIAGDNYLLSQEKTYSKDRVEWFTEARFGMFIHFGLYSIPAGVWDGEISGRNMYAEWIQKQGNWPYGIPDEEYRALAGEFNPVKFDAEEWVLEAKNAGMKYLLITAKHHDGFALWPSEVSEFDVMDATPFKRDILGELNEACKRHGIELGFYYSHWQDWEHPGGAKPREEEFKSVPPPEEVSDEMFEKYWQEKCLPQVQELIENYNPALLWFDTWGRPEIITDERLNELIGLVRELDSDCLINSRILMKHPDIADKVDFLSMGDNSFPDETIKKPWETSGTMNHSWGYHKLDHHWEPAKGLLMKLVGNASRNGNFQLNVGPKGDGSFPVAAIKRLREIGAWMYANSEAVYGTDPNPYHNVDWGYITSKEISNGRKLYLHVAQMPESNEIVVYGPEYLPEKVYVLETGQELDFFPHHGLAVKLPQEWAGDGIMVIVAEIKEDFDKVK